MGKRLKPYGKAVSLGLQTFMEYRVNLLIMLFSCLFPVLMQLFLWSALYTNSGQAVIFGYTYPQMLLYSILATVMSKIIGYDYCDGVAKDIKDGTLNRFLIKPVNHFLFVLCEFVGGKLVNLLTLMALSLGTAGVFHFAFGISFTAGQPLLFLTAVGLALVLKFILSYCICASAFWLTENWGLLLAANVVGLVISGAYFPLDIFGPVAVGLSRLLPFYYTIYFPVNILNGTLSPIHIWQGYLVQLVWIILLKLLSNLVWRRGVRHYIAAGG